MNLVDTIYAMTIALARVPCELPRGLHLVHYPADRGQPARLIAARHLSTPSPTELRVVRDALLAALDLHQYRVVTSFAADWTEHNHGDWNGYQIAYTMQSAADAFSLDVDTRDRIRLALEHRAARIEKRRKKAAKVKPADKPDGRTLFEVVAAEPQLLLGRGGGDPAPTA